MTSVLPLLMPLFVLLGIYEFGMGIWAFRKGEKPAQVIKYFVAAVVMFVIVILLHKLDATVVAIAPVRN